MPTKNTSKLVTPLQEQEFKQYQQARRTESKPRYSSSAQAVISGKYGLSGKISVELFLQNNTL